VTVPILAGARVTLRAPRPEDAADRLRCGRDVEFVRMVGGDPRAVAPLTAAEAAGWAERLAAEPWGWTVEYQGRCIGVARLHGLNEADRRALYAVGIYDPACRGLGLGQEITRLVLRYAFGELGLHRVGLRVLAFNARARACYEKCGFRQEGVERESALVGGEWYDDVMMAVLEHEFRRLEGEV
jgi:RimJ/RimL family protein N-acetyltransferase